MKRHICTCLAVVFVFMWSELVAGNSPKHNKTHHPHHATNKDSVTHSTLFSADEVERMKEFFISNTALQEQPKDSNWRPGYRHKCINTVRAALDFLLFGESSIPDSLYSRQPVLNGHYFNNDVNALVHRLKDSGYISGYDSIRFLSMRKGAWTLISKSDPVSRGLQPVTMEKGLWNTLLARVGKTRGFSVFIISLCDGYHAAILTLDHRTPSQLKVYWSDQTHRHPLRFYINEKLQEEPNKYGWEVMHGTGIDAIKPGVVRGLDAYALYANKKYWCDCGHENGKDDDCCPGNCFPFIQIWRVQKNRNIPMVTH
jgi:hypothetical protein